ncbi:MAG TPA: LysR family transcriptional regulator [Ktedonobacteraceae bacterium]|jgi:DNA-binding transcriptional LysR family regulator|nr:LysR family transcriptional regulator [Ktedonobacteraceae bacterium]
MDLLQLKYFQVVAQLEHMTRAAEKLYLAQPSLSQSIARLEEELGVPLFDRQGRRIHLNQFGRAFLKRVERIFLELEEGKREVADMAGLEHGSIALAVASTQPLPELLSGFLARYPRVRFRLFQQQSLTTVVQQLERGEIDLCISSPPIEQPGITWVPLLTEELFLLVPAGHRLAARDSIRLIEAAREPFICLKPGHGLRDLMDDLCKQAGFEPDIAFEGDETATVRGLVTAGLGVTFVAGKSWQSRTSDQPFAMLHIEEPVCQRTIGLAWLEDRYLSEASRRFREFVIEYFSSLETSELPARSHS